MQLGRVLIKARPNCINDVLEVADGRASGTRADGFAIGH